jgi:replication initiation and membrane attachment protein DnaB
MEEGWVKIYQTNNSYDAEIIKQVMERENIACIVMNKQDSSFFFGSIEIYVQEDDQEAAKKIIQNPEP